MDHYRPSKRPRLDGQERTTCLYCDRRIPIEEHQRHRFEKHFDLQFKCAPCIEMLSTLHQGHFPSLDQLKKHMGEVHGETNIDNEDKLQELIRNGMIILPSDLRSLDCRFCEGAGGKKILLGQDRMAMAIHIRHRHNMKIPRHVFKYQCRMCHEEFKTSENLLSAEHQCQQLIAQFHESARSNTIGLERVGEAGPSTTIGQEGSSSGTKLSNGELCHYCPDEYPVENKASHRGKHLDLDFLCGKCTRSFPYLEDIKHHLSKDHELVVEADDGLDGKHLADNGWLVMPKDLRVIQCPECQQPFLAQDRQTVLSHMKKMHGKVIGGQEKGLINYGCRACNKTDFTNSAEVFEHDCLPKSKYDRNGLGGDLALRSSEELLPLTDLEWITGDMQVPGDLRRMACRLCGFQVNGQRFFKMVHHLEEKHDKYQQCRAYKLDFFVKFGCGHCPQFQCESVHTWDKHFQDEYCTKCAAMCCMTDEPTSNPTNSNIANGVANATVEKKNKVLPNDIRLLICKICSATFPKRGFEDIQAHLKSEHTQEIVDAPKLSDFVDFGCIKCPKYSPQSLVEWKDHFHLRNTTCDESHAALVAAANLSAIELDCRKLVCKLCNFVCSDYYVLCKHLEVHHNIDTKPSNFRFKEVFDFLCHRCPNFKPEDKHRWDRHFSSDNQFCQGSGKVPVLLGGKSRVLYWCDACQETRENIQAHFTGSSHRAAMEALLSNSTTNNTQIITCDPCSISFTSQGNFDLHLLGDFHREKQIEASSSLNSDTTTSSASITIMDDIVNNAAVCI